MPKIYFPPQDTKKWAFIPKGELLGQLWYGKNIDPRVNEGKLRLSERVKSIFDTSDSAEMDGDGWPREFIRTNADSTDRWWAMVRSADDATGGFFNTSGVDPTSGWAQDSSLSFPATGRDSAETFLRVGGYDRLITPSNTRQDLAMLNNGNAGSVSIVSSTNASPIAITATAHGLTTDDQVTIAGHTINTNANGTWRITRTGANTFTLNNSTGNGVGGADGTVTKGKWINRWWSTTLGQSNFDNTVPVVVKRFNKILLIGNLNYVHVITPSADGTITSSSNVSYKRLTFPDNYFVNCIVVTPFKAWIGLCDSEGGSAIVAAWDGGEETYETPSKLYDRFVLAMEIVDGVPWALNGKGQILQYNGAAFVQKEAFPCFYQTRRWTDQSVNTTVPTVIHRNGMKVIDGQLHFLIKGTMDASEANILEDMPSGLWVYDLDHGLYCKYSIGQYRSTNNDWGARILKEVGAIVETSGDKGKFLVGARVFADNQTGSLARSQIMISDSASSNNNRGHFVTGQIQAGDVSALWKYLMQKFKRMENTSDMIVVKARTDANPNVNFSKQAAVTASTNSVFTSTDSDFANVSGGEEIEILVGKGAGATAHVSSITSSGSTYTVTLDEAIPNFTSTALVAINNFQKVGSLSNDQLVPNRIYDIMRDSPWVQFKIELRGTLTSPELDEMQVEYAPQGV